MPPILRRPFGGFHDLRAPAQPECLQGEGPEPHLPGLFIEHDFPGARVFFVLVGVDVPDGRRAGPELRQRIFEPVLHQFGGEHQSGSGAQSGGEFGIGLPVFRAGLAVGQDHVQSDCFGVRRGHQAHAFGQGRADAGQSAAVRKGGLIDGQDYRFRRPGFGLVSEEYLVVGVIVELRAEFVARGHPRRKGGRQQAGIGRRTLPPTWFHKDAPIFPV